MSWEPVPDSSREDILRVVERSNELLEASNDLLEQMVELLKEMKERNKPKVRREQLVNDGLPELAKVWNEWADARLPRVVAMESSSTRFKSCTERWRAKPDRDYWVGVIRRVNLSSFCLGQNDRQWLATIDWLCRPDQHAKILEGKYDDKKPIEKQKTVIGYYTDADGQQRPVLK